jgi:acetyltransferase EpsM
MQSCVIYGTGGHAKVLYDLALLNGYRVVFFFDDNVSPTGIFKNIPVASYDPNCYQNVPMLISIGNNRLRRDISRKTLHHSCFMKHPHSIVASDVSFGEGTVILSGAVVQTDTKIGRHCIINIGCSIDHDVSIGDFVHISPNAYIGGGVSIGEGVTVGAGAVIMRNTNVPAWTEIASNSVIR